MSKIGDREIDTQCRLCTSTEEGRIHIFGPEGESLYLAVKIKECLPITIEKSDALPKNVCKTCVEKLDMYFKFRKSSLLAEAHFTSVLKEPVSAPFPLEPECCLQEVEQPSSSARPPPLVPKSIASSFAGTVPKSLDIFPASSFSVPPSTTKLVKEPNILVVTPVASKTQEEEEEEDEEDEKAQEENPSRWSRVGQPLSDDYVLMKEDVFMVDSSYIDNHSRSLSRLVASGQIEFHPYHQAAYSMDQDKDIILAQKRRREVMPPMWDVYEKVPMPSGKENQSGNGKVVYAVTHRRYIIAKGAFPCSLCQKCFRINQGFDREGSEWERDENSADYPNSKSSDCDEQGGKNDNKDMKFFSCHICFKVFPRRSSLKRHQRTHMERKLFSCPLCQKGFNRKEHLSRHMISHSGGRPYHCDICEKPFTRKEHLSRHRLCHFSEYLNDSSSNFEVPSNESSIQTNGVNDVSIASGQDDDSSPNSVKPFVCDLCGQGFARKEHLLRHQIRTHRTTAADIRDELKPYNCSICSKNFTRKEHLVRHQKIHMREFLIGSARGVIPGTDVSVSPVLTNRATSSGGTVMKTEPPEGPVPHSNLPSLTISAVPPKSETSSAYENPKKHVQIHENGHIDGDIEVPKQPSQDNTEEETVTVENEHGYVEDSEESGSTVLKPHRCVFCSNKAFTRRSHLVRHFNRFHSEQSLSLDLSNRRGETPKGDQEFETHVLTNGAYWCKICCKAFRRRYHLLRHMKLHGPNEVAHPFHCSACNKSFSKYEQFQVHKCTIGGKEGETTEEQTQEKMEVVDGNLPAEIAEPKEIVKKIPAKRDKRKRSKCNYECVTCGKGFSKKKFLNRHSETHPDLTEDNSQPLY